MLEFTVAIKKFNEQGEKTGWTYIDIPSDITDQLKPGNKKSFRVKGKLDEYKIAGVALIPMGGGKFIMPLNAVIRKGIAKKKGAMLTVKIEEDKKPYKLNNDFVACLSDEPSAEKHFSSLSKSHQHYFSKWIESAKTDNTRTKRITMAVNALARQMGFPEMLRAEKARKNEMGQ